LLYDALVNRSRIEPLVREIARGVGPVKNRGYCFSGTAGFSDSGAGALVAVLAADMASTGLG